MCSFKSTFGGLVWLFACFEVEVLRVLQDLGLTRTGFAV